MVFLESFKMSSSKAHQAPSPPTVEQILEDLSAASDEDVIFKSVILEQGTRTKKEVKEEDALEQTVDRRDVATEDRGSTEQKPIKGQSNEQIYGKVASFLEQFKSLESAKEQLNCLEEDLKLKKETLEAAISKVEAAWKVSKSDG